LIKNILLTKCARLLCVDFETRPKWKSFLLLTKLEATKIVELQQTNAKFHLELADPADCNAPITKNGSGQKIAE